MGPPALRNHSSADASPPRCARSRFFFRALPFTPFGISRRSASRAVAPFGISRYSAFCAVRHLAPFGIPALFLLCAVRHLALSWPCAVPPFRPFP
jgi:hypothetical protein